MAEELNRDTGADSVVQIPANYIDVKLHGVFNVPSTWAQESGAAPIFNDHVFRYEMSVGVAGQTHVFPNGRLLHDIPMYHDFIAQSKLPPVVPNLDEEDGDGDGDVPEGAPVPPRSATPSEAGDEVATPPQTGRNVEGDTDGDKPNLSAGGAPLAVLWVLGPEVDTEVKDDVGKKDTKPAPKKGAVAAPPPVSEVVKPIPPNTVAPPACVARFALSLDQLSAFEAQVENLEPLTFTFRRVLRAGVPAEWEDTQEAKFVAKVDLSLKGFTAPGSKLLDGYVPLEPANPEPQGADDKGAKGKKAAPKKTKGTAPAVLTEELDPSEAHPYVANKTQAHITIVAFAPVTRLPQGRPRPELQPSDMIPKRMMPPRRPVEATKRFSHEIEGLVARIVRDYRHHRDRQPPDAASTDELRASFLQTLGTSGRSRVYQDLLVPSVQGIVKETFIRKSAATPEEMDKVSNELYTYLLDHMHLTLNRTFAAPSAAEANLVLEGDPVERWRRLAMEAEVMHEYAIAARYHQERLVQCRNKHGEAELPDVWCEYAEFCLRVRDALKAEQGYREALAIDMAHLPSLVGYGALLLARQRFREAEVFLQSAVDIDGNAITWGCLALYHDMLLLSIADSPHEETRRTVCRRESKYAMTQAIRTNGDNSSPAEVYEALGKHLLGLHHEELANVCLSRAPKTAGVEILMAKVFKQTNQLDDAVGILQDVIAANPQNAEARLLLGDVYATMGNHSVEAEQNYDAALRIDPHCGTGPSYVRLGNMYVALGKHKDALSSFLMGAKVWPCGLTWLGVGIAYYRMDDLVRAEQALSESNVLNSLNPKTWAYLALVCLRQRREDEGDQAFNQAIKQSLSDPYLIAEVGSEQMRLGRHRIAEACFRRSIAIQDDCNTRMHLARSLAALNRLGDARDEYAYVARTTTNEAQRARAEEQMSSIPVE
jgi:tetratricopeptide (TPR) repeat protein